MLICHCRAVNDATVRTVVLAGAHTVDDVADRCGAGSRCGGCTSAVQELLDQITADDRVERTTAA